MIPLGKLKQNLEFNSSIGNIIEVLKIGASIQLRQLQMRDPLYKDFLDGLKDFTRMLEGENVPHPLLTLRKNLPRCIVGITSDGGFLGELNTLIINALLDRRKDRHKDVLVVLGGRGAGYLQDVGISPVVFPGVTDRLKQDEVEKLKGYLIREYLKGKFSEVLIVYPKFLSITNQRIESVRLLPCSFELMEEDTEKKQEEEGLSFLSEERLLIEPRISDVIEELVRLWTGFMIADIFWSSKLSEFAARLMHLDGSQQRLNKVNQQLRVEYFRYVHMLADKTIREISATRFIRKN